MKLVFLILAFSSCNLFAQVDITIEEVEGPHFCFLDTIWFGKRNPPRDGFCNMEKTGGKNYYTFGSYQRFAIYSDSLKEAYQTILEYDLTFPENGKYENLGEFRCHELHSASKDEDPYLPGKYRETWAFYVNIKVDFNGEYLRFEIPEVKNKNLTSEAHYIYVPKECINDCLNTFKYK